MRSGLEAIAYRLTDSHMESAPSPLDGRAIGLPDAWCCFRPPPDSPAVSALPASSEGVITFGSFNNFTKINEHVLALWARILNEVAGSRLLLVVKGSRQERARRFLEERGIGADRVEFLAYYAVAASEGGKLPPPAYLLRYHRIDIALDPFPYNGMTTTCDALWMGVPVVALIGGTTLGRASHSLLSNVGVPGLAAESEEDYVRIATGLAHDIPRLAGLRATLRERMEKSPLLDAPTLRAIWKPRTGRRG